MDLAAGQLADALIMGENIIHFHSFHRRPELDETTFFETETRPRPGLVKISRPRRDREFCEMIFRDRDETENSVK